MDDTIKGIIEGLLKNLNISVNRILINEEEEGRFVVDISSDDSSILIGFHGETIFALQHLVKVLLWKKYAEIKSLFLDVDNYRKRQQENVIALAERKADAVRISGAQQSLPSMSPYFRRLVHLHLATASFSDLTTSSVGEGDRRQIIIKLK